MGIYGLLKLHIRSADRPQLRALSRSEGRFDTTIVSFQPSILRVARRFVEEWNTHGPAHHCAIGVGHIASKIKKLGELLGIVTVQVC